MCIRDSAYVEGLLDYCLSTLCRCCCKLLLLLLLLTVACRTNIYRCSGQRSWHGRLERATYFKHRRKIESRLGRCKGLMIATLNRPNMPNINLRESCQSCHNKIVRFKKRVLQGNQFYYFLTRSVLFLAPSLVLGPLPAVPPPDAPVASLLVLLSLSTS